MTKLSQVEHFHFKTCFQNFTSYLEYSFSFLCNYYSLDMNITLVALLRYYYIIFYIIQNSLKNLICKLYSLQSFIQVYSSNNIFNIFIKIHDI